jgi:hypothetical protein
MDSGPVYWGLGSLPQNPPEDFAETGNLDVEARNVQQIVVMPNVGDQIEGLVWDVDEALDGVHFDLPEVGR